MIMKTVLIHIVYKNKITQKSRNLTQFFLITHLNKYTYNLNQTGAKNINETL